MSTRQWGGVIRQLRKTVLLRDAASLTDGQLLECFLAQREEAAFEALVRRHGSMVLAVCRRVLRDTHDAEDAFQATFLVLVRKAASVQPRELVGNWLYGVAYRTALEARTILARRRARERQVSDMPEQPAPDAAVVDDWRPVLDQELTRLPEKYRSAVVLCDLEGRPRKEVALALRIPEGTLSSRLAMARRMLASRLTRRGVTLSGGALATVLAESTADAAVSAPLVASTVQAATVLASGQALAAGIVSAKVVFLTEGVMKAMFVTKIKSVTAVCVLLAVLGGGVGLVGHATRAETPDSENDGQLKSQKEKLKKELSPSTGDARLNKEVDKKLSAAGDFKYQNIPLSDVLDELRDHTGLNIIVDRQALAEAQIAPEQQVVTIRLDKVSFRTALKHILHDAGLTYTVQDGVLIVTTPLVDLQKKVRRVYSVADLVGDDPQAAEDLIRVIRHTVGSPRHWVPRKEPGGSTDEDFASNLEGGSVEYFAAGRSLVISQTSAIQEEIQELLSDLRAAKKEQEKLPGPAS
jgi:RNA polymerase sigma factor (sigma-70 family)